MEKDVLYPLRRLHGRFGEWREETRQHKNMRRYLCRGKGAKVLVPGTPEHVNLGDSAITIAQMLFLERCGFSKEAIKEVTFSEYKRLQKTIVKTIDHSWLITQLGGGNMGSQWMGEERFHRRITEDFPNNPMIIFPQTICYSPEAETEEKESVPVYNNKKNLTIVAREEKSHKIMKGLYPQTKIMLTPDIVLSATMDDFGAERQRRSGVLFCMRNDAERSMSDADRIASEKAIKNLGLAYRYTDMYSEDPTTKENRDRLVRGKMEEMASAQLIITDRLHGMIFAALTETPCIVFSNYNHKVLGTYEWIRHLPYIRYVESSEEAIQQIPELLSMEQQFFDNAPLISYFEVLAEEVRRYAFN